MPTHAVFDPHGDGLSRSTWTVTLTPAKQLPRTRGMTALKQNRRRLRPTGRFWLDVGKIRPRHSRTSQIDPFNHSHCRKADLQRINLNGVERPARHSAGALIKTRYAITESPHPRAAAAIAGACYIRACRSGVADPKKGAIPNTADARSTCTRRGSIFHRTSKANDPSRIQAPPSIAPWKHRERSRFSSRCT
jgi:hypothetical protein